MATWVGRDMVYLADAVFGPGFFCLLYKTRHLGKAMPLMEMLIWITLVILKESSYCCYDHHLLETVHPTGEERGAEHPDEEDYNDDGDDCDHTC